MERLEERLHFQGLSVGKINTLDLSKHLGDLGIPIEAYNSQKTVIVGSNGNKTVATLSVEDEYKIVDERVIEYKFITKYGMNVILSQTQTGILCVIHYGPEEKQILRLARIGIRNGIYNAK
jgi:hypothetical protein